MMSTNSPRSLFTNPIGSSSLERLQSNGIASEGARRPSFQELRDQIPDPLDAVAGTELPLLIPLVGPGSLLGEELLRRHDRRNPRRIGGQIRASVLRLRRRDLEAALEDERRDVLHLVRVEPGAVAAAPVDDDARAVSEVLPLHAAAADRT